MILYMKFASEVGPDQWWISDCIPRKCKIFEFPESNLQTDSAKISYITKILHFLGKKFEILQFKS